MLPPRRFYIGERPFRKLDPHTGSITFETITRLEPGHVYAGGSFAELRRLTNWMVWMSHMHNP